MSDYIKRLERFLISLDRAGEGSLIVYEADAVAEDLRRALADVERMRGALEIIAGYRRCTDNLMSNSDIARQALSAPEERE